MPTALSTSQSRELASLAGLRRRVEQTLLRAQHQVEEVKIRAYWETGRDINEHIKLNGGRAEYGKKAMEELSEKIGQDFTVVERCAQFEKKFPERELNEILAIWRESASRPHKTSKNVSSAGPSWSHFRVLIPVLEDKVRFRLARQAARYGWTVEELEEKIRRMKVKGLMGPGPVNGARPLQSRSATQHGGSAAIFGGSRESSLDPRLKRAGMTKKNTLYSLLKPRIGKLYTYGLVDSKKAGWPSNRVGFGARPKGVHLLLDRGFRAYRELTGKESSRFKAGDIVEIVGARSPRPGRGNPAPTQEIIPSTHTDKDRYFYRAYSAKVIDGDTLWAGIDVGAPEIEAQKLRLRGVNAEEINTPKGRKAWRFVKSLLPEGTPILIRTSVHPTYDRFEADVLIPVNELTRGVVEKTQPKGIQSKIETIDVGAGSPRPYYFLNNLLLERRLAVRVRD